ncbi:RNA-protein complex protein Nop10 [Methanoculleus taiwanensis]|uniref:RNA-protein complex protein Nop10 n=1 Tax=Methanoculleus taiwanensis TaxID=1550565 RepID=UPI000FFED6DD|nr:RNA-protein complex protein Nop10 [Methanoculleus taiwanensis]
MSGRIRRCAYDRTYTLRETCPACGCRTRVAHPARFSPQDRYGRYRRMVRE